jgi:hypothetical protein
MANSRFDECLSSAFLTGASVSLSSAMQYAASLSAELENATPI